MDGRRRGMDSIFVERLWRTVKYENIFLNEYVSVPALTTGLQGRQLPKHRAAAPEPRILGAR